MNKEVQHYIRNCKCDTFAPFGLLQPLPIPTEVWLNISMDFTKGLSKSQGKEVLWVVVDQLSKYAHFIALSHPYSVEDVAQAYLDNIFKLYGLPNSIVSDRDTVFLNSF